RRVPAPRIRAVSQRADETRSGGVASRSDSDHGGTGLRRRRKSLTLRRYRTVFVEPLQAGTRWMCPGEKDASTAPALDRHQAQQGEHATALILGDEFGRHV